jgi:hypothetical protein
VSSAPAVDSPSPVASPTVIPSPTAVPTSAPTSPRAAGSVAVTRTGGIAGVRQRIEIAADGSWTFTDQKAGKSQTGTLTGAQRQQLSTMVADPALAAEAHAAAAPGACADGFTYAIEAGELSLRHQQCGNTVKTPRTDALLRLVTAATPL